MANASAFFHDGNFSSKNFVEYLCKHSCIVIGRLINERVRDEKIASFCNSFSLMKIFYFAEPTIAKSQVLSYR